MNITVTIDELDMGGAQHIAHELAKRLDKSKYKITIICTDGKTDSILERQMIEEQKNGDYSLVFMKKPLYLHVNTPSKFFNRALRRLIRLPSDLLSLPSLCREVKKTKPDIVHAHQHGILAGYWTLFHGVPMIATVHTSPSVTFYRESEKIIFKALVFHRRITLVGISKYNGELIKKYWRLKNADVHYVNNGVNIEEYRRAPHETFAFINTSRQDKNKNQSLILRAFARLHNEKPDFPIKLFLVGGGDTHEKLKEEARKLGISELVEFTGYVKSTKERLALADVYVSSSHREGLSLSALEAMACGLPVIATDAGGVRDLARDNGILVADDDEDGLFAAMKKLRDDGELRRVMGGKSLEMVRAYSASEMAEKYAALYDEHALKKTS